MKKIGRTVGTPSFTGYQFEDASGFIDDSLGLKLETCTRIFAGWLPWHLGHQPRSKLMHQVGWAVGFCWDLWTTEPPFTGFPHARSSLCDGNLNAAFKTTNEFIVSSICLGWLWTPPHVLWEIEIETLLYQPGSTSASDPGWSRPSLAPKNASKCHFFRRSVDPVSSHVCNYWGFVKFGDTRPGELT